VVGAAVVAFNAVLLVPGAALWSVQIWLTDLIVMTLIFRLIRWRRWRNDVDVGRRRAVRPDASGSATDNRLIAVSDPYPRLLTGNADE
jgi:hypothetical protein